MNIAKLSLIVIVLGMFISCDDSPSVVHNILEFKNCRATKMWAVSGRKYNMEIADMDVYGLEQINDLNEDGILEVAAHEYTVVLFTTEMTDSLYYPESPCFPAFTMRDSIMRDSNFVEQRIKYIEEQLTQSYQLYEDQSYSNEGLDWVRIEYRTNGVEGLTITSTSKLWGEEPGNNLNEYFNIDYYIPNTIVEFDSQRLIYGFTDTNEMPESIDEYISLYPMAPPSIGLILNETPPELPCDVQFFVQMTTNDGYVLTDSTKIVHITSND